jgi:hypothetical protein
MGIVAMKYINTSNLKKQAFSFSSLVVKSQSTTTDRQKKNAPVI